MQFSAAGADVKPGPVVPNTQISADRRLFIKAAASVCEMSCGRLVLYVLYVYVCVCCYWFSIVPLVSVFYACFRPSFLLYREYL